MMDAANLVAWNSFHSTVAEASATLTGLLFVAVSINQALILSTPGLTGRVAEPLLQLLAVVAIAAAYLVPGVSLFALGVIVLTITVAVWVPQIWMQWKYVAAKMGHPVRYILSRVVQTHLISVPFLVAGVLLMCGIEAGLYWSAVGFLLSLAGAIVSGWVLLIEIVR